jgi:predicted transcriptional regulator
MVIFSPEIIKKKRLERGISLVKMALLTEEIDPKGKGVSQMTCARIEKEGYDPRVSSLVLISAALDISPKSSFTKKV